MRRGFDGFPAFRSRIRGGENPQAFGHIREGRAQLLNAVGRDRLDRRGDRFRHILVCLFRLGRKSRLRCGGKRSFGTRR